MTAASGRDAASVSMAVGSIAAAGGNDTAECGVARAAAPPKAVGRRGSMAAASSSGDAESCVAAGLRAAARSGDAAKSGRATGSQTADERRATRRPPSVPVKPSPGGPCSGTRGRAVLRRPRAT